MYIRARATDALKWQKSNIVKVFKTLVMGKWFSLSRLEFISHLQFSSRNTNSRDQTWLRAAKPNGLFDTLSPNPLKKSNKTKTKEILRICNRPLQWAVFKMNKPFDFVEFFGTFDFENIFALRISIKIPFICMPSTSFPNRHGSHGRGKLFWLLNN